MSACPGSEFLIHVNLFAYIYNNQRFIALYMLLIC